MREILYFKNRFEFAMKNSSRSKDGSFGTIHINRKDLEALQELIRTFNEININTNLEDSLLLFWLMNFWKVEIQQSILSFRKEPKYFLKLTNAETVFDKLCLLLNPKEIVIQEIIQDLQTDQRERGITEKNFIPDEVVREFLETTIKEVKSNFTPITELVKARKVIYNYPESVKQ